MIAGRILRGLRSDNSGLAMVEFAVSLPVLLTLGLCGLEVAHFASAKLRVGELAMLTADNAARVRSEIDEVDVNELMTGAKLIGEPINFAQNGRIILSSLQQNAAANGQWIRWQRCDGALNVASSYGLEGKGQSDATLQAMGPAGNQIAALPGTAVMFVEVTYKYQPLVGNFLFGPTTFRRVSAFNVRQRTDQSLHNRQNLGSNDISNCANYSA